ncbi:hypothetical protein C439_17993 [Haloferax mediterranei ATCC 33500]|uniref:Uncharacterized protein n=1 Tax=Haloferax mediterranei (strain ATCC 33500 / DSM 1411 / JCM 8866 / NBRC 14739 / NCIMB 2177 / R-4) TaxID=523841 RepID=M0IP26_HALMT|nr:hypothetical protein C439_17993 [Haloferax mediterranei ATCC 33500]
MSDPIVFDKLASTQLGFVCNTLEAGALVLADKGFNPTRVRL